MLSVSLLPPKINELAPHHLLPGLSSLRLLGSATHRSAAM
jgi:hypothetical protein